MHTNSFLLVRRRRITPVSLFVIYCYWHNEKFLIILQLLLWTLSIYVWYFPPSWDLSSINIFFVFSNSHDDSELLFCKICRWMSISIIWYTLWYGSMMSSETCHDSPGPIMFSDFFLPYRIIILTWCWGLTVPNLSYFDTIWCRAARREFDHFSPSTI